MDDLPELARGAGIESWSADPFLRSTTAVDWATPGVLTLALELGSGTDDTIEVARRCFEWVRDRIAHTMDYGHDLVTYRASDVLREGTGFCFAKSHLLVALLRANGIRAGLAYQRLALDHEGKARVYGAVVVEGTIRPGNEITLIR